MSDNEQPYLVIGGLDRHGVAFTSSHLEQITSLSASQLAEELDLLTR